jgi:plastocyanin
MNPIRVRGSAALLSLVLSAWGCSSNSAAPEQGTQASFAGCTFEAAVAGSEVDIAPPVAYAPPCLRIRAGASVLIQANAMHPLQGMVKNGSTPNPIAEGEPATGWLQDTSFTFPSAGAYGFFCNVHGSDTSKPGSMVGVVYVEP